MNLKNIFLCLDIDNTILDSSAQKQAIGEIVGKIMPGSSSFFWRVYESTRQSNGSINLDSTITAWARQYGLSRDILVRQLKELPFEKFLFPDFIEAIDSLRQIGKIGFFSNGPVWYQKQKVLRIKNFLQLPCNFKNSILSTNKADLFDKIDSKSVQLFSVYVEDRPEYLEMALEKKAIDLGVFICRSRCSCVVNSKILVVASFGELVSELKGLSSRV